MLLPADDGDAIRRHYGELNPEGRWIDALDDVHAETSCQTTLAAAAGTAVDPSGTLRERLTPCSCQMLTR